MPAGRSDLSSRRCGERLLDRGQRDLIVEQQSIIPETLELLPHRLIPLPAAHGRQDRPRVTKKLVQGKGSGQVNSASAAA